jgi:4-cresol dehydrogenase (hydroxylating)
MTTLTSHSARTDATWLQQLATVVGPSNVFADDAVRDRYARSSSGNAAGTRPAAVVAPDSTEQVQALMPLAQQHELTLYPIARGRNWGYGDACAPSDGQVIVDLSRMNRIVEVNAELGYAVIEPGVTQGQLARYLNEHHPELWCDVTGAGHDASLMGNTLDRGFGHTPYGDHARQSCGMSVVLANGTLLRTGMERFPGSRSRYAYGHGLGPQLEGLFQQANMGIVTRLGLWLMPAPEQFCAFFLQPKKSTELQDLVDALAPLRRQGLLTSAIHIGNDLRVLSGRMRYPWQRTGGQTPLPEAVRAELRREHGLAEWNVGGGIYGSKGTVRAVKHDLSRAVRGIATVRFVDDRRLALAERAHDCLARFDRGARLGQMLNWLKPVYGLMRGQPSDEPLWGTLWRVRDDEADQAYADDEPAQPPDPLSAHAGLRWVSPVLPNTGRDAERVRQIVEPIYHAHGFEPLMTFTMISERAMIAVTNLAFDTRETEEAQRADQCYHALNDALLAAGYVPYRAGHAGQRKLAEVTPVFTDVAQRLKRALDPEQRIAPGRYIPAA